MQQLSFLLPVVIKYHFQTTFTKVREENVLKEVVENSRKEYLVAAKQRAQ